MNKDDGPEPKNRGRMKELNITPGLKKAVDDIKKLGQVSVYDDENGIPTLHIDLNKKVKTSA